MKPFAVVLFIVVLCISLFTQSCTKETEVPQIGCNLETDQMTAPQGLTVEYLLKGEGDYVVSGFYYYGTDGKVSISNPVVPYFITLQIPEGTSIQAGAEGSVKEGNIEISYKAYNSESNFEGAAVCSQTKP
jgi:hypothetical protein